MISPLTNHLRDFKIHHKYDMESKGSRSGSNSLLDWSGPHTVVIPRVQSDFGFTLRHLVVYPPQSVFGNLRDESGQPCKDSHPHLTRELSLEPQETIFVKSIREGGPAHYAGLNTGDRILAINGLPISGKPYRDVIAAIHESENSLQLLVVPKDEDILQMAYQSQTRDRMFPSNSTLSDNVRLTGVGDFHKHSHSSSDIVHGTVEKPFDYSSNVNLPHDYASNVNLPYDRHEVRYSYPLSQWGHKTPEYRFEDFPQVQTEESLLGQNCLSQAVTTDTVFHSQQQPDLSQDMEANMTSNITYNIPSRSKYSFGLYFPPKTSEATPSGSHAVSTDNLRKGYKDPPDQPGITKSQTFEISQRRPVTACRKTSTDENSTLTSSARSREFFIRYSSDKAASDNRNRYSPRYSTFERCSSDTRPAYIMSRSQTVSTLSPSNSGGEPSRKMSEYAKSSSLSFSDTSRSCQYIPVITENKQQRGSEYAEKKTEVSGFDQSSLCSEKTDPATGSRTFVLSIPYGQQTQQQQSRVTESGYIPVRQVFGTTYAVTRSPTAAHIEIQKSIGKPIVSQRKYQFESVSSKIPSNGNDGQNRYRTEIDKIRTQPKFSSIAVRKASFEQSPDRDPPGYDDADEFREQSPSIYSDPKVETAHSIVKVRKISSERYSGSPHQSLENIDKSGVVKGGHDAASIRIIVSPSNTSASPLLVSMSPRENIAQPTVVQSLGNNKAFKSSEDGYFHSLPSNTDNTSSFGIGGSTASSGLTDSGVWLKSYHSSDMLDGVDGTTDSGSATEQEGSSTSKHKGYLSAVSGSVQRSSTNSLSTESSGSIPVTNITAASMMSVSDSALPTGHIVVGHDVQVSAEQDYAENASISVAMRKKLQESLEEQANKLHRRTSYLMATARDRTNAVPLEETFSASQDILNQKLQHPGGTARRNSSIKLNKFFGETIPSISEGVETKSIDYDESPEIIRKGPLSCKISAIEGKKCSDRSWKPVYAVLRPTELFLTRDRDTGSASSSFEDQHIPLKACTVECAREYAKKKKNVFRLTTQNDSDYLFQTEDRGMMMCWIQGIKSINEPERTEKVEEIIASEREKQVQSPIEVNIIPSSKTSPQLGHKGKKLSALSFKSKLTSSPNMKRKKSNAAEKDKEEGLKKGWKDRIPMMKSLKKHSEDPNLLLSAEQEIDTDKFQFGVPLEDCFPSPHNEYVPLIVELCTRIVEARGLEVVGVYRVPGNSAAVTALTEEFNRGIDSVNIDNEKLLDINVISSLLKSFFRKLPEPLIPTNMYDAFIEANRYPDEDKRKLKIKRLLHLLPAHHNETLKHMAEHLNKVASYGNINKMDAKNLAIMFGPTLVRKKGDDTVSLVTDMSDQCRIVESIILHHEWFFSPWDQDSYIPMETTVETVPVEEGHNLSKDDDEEADSAISTKEIISSIVGAASKKLRQQQQKSLESLDMVDSCSTTSASTFRDRNSSDTVYLSSFAKSLSSINTSLGTPEEYIGRKSSVPATTRYQESGHNTSVASDFSELKFVDTSSPTSSHFSRDQSEDLMRDKNDELEISHELPTSFSREAINRLKRIGEDVTALLQTFEQKHQKERERRRWEQEMVEREHFLTQLELEQEENHSVEDWLAWESGIPSLGMPDLVSSSYFGDTSSGENYSDSFSASKKNKEKVDKKKIKQESKPKLEPHVQTVAKVASVSPQIASLTSSTAQQCNICRGGSHENIVSHSRNQHQGKAVSTPKPSQHLLQENQQKTAQLIASGVTQQPVSVRNSLAKRHGSLDSMIDMIDKQDKRISWASTDSEDGTDLLTSITATFDQKLEILLNPKYKLTGKKSVKHEASNISDSANDGATDREPAWQKKSFQSRSPLNTKQVYTVASLLESDRSFRDPSLHRSARSDPKIGIASRFERNDIGKTTYLSPLAVTSTSVSTNLGKEQKDLLDFRTSLDKPESQTQESATSAEPQQCESGTISKVSLQEKPTETLTESVANELKASLVCIDEKQLSEHKSSATEEGQPKEPDKVKRLLRRHICRRHTVGGIEDFIHNSVLSQFHGKTRVCSAFGCKLPALKLLHSIIKDSCAPRNTDILKSKRGSTPDLSCP